MRTTTLDRLPRGVTGFDGFDRIALVPAPRFKTACYAVARHIRGRVRAFEACEDRVTANHHAATFQTPDGSVSALCNLHHPFLAFVPAGGHAASKPVFLPPGGIGRAFAELTGFEPLDPVFLNGALTPELLEDLGPSELGQLRHWRRASGADRVGDVVFNTWD